jgi:hypothetical protein
MIWREREGLVVDLGVSYLNISPPVESQKQKPPETKRLL